jgi:hypothetical protein
MRRRRLIVACRATPRTSRCSELTCSAIPSASRMSEICPVEGSRAETVKTRKPPASRRFPDGETRTRTGDNVRYLRAFVAGFGGRGRLISRSRACARGSRRRPLCGRPRLAATRSITPHRSERLPIHASATPSPAPSGPACSAAPAIRSIERVEGNSLVRPGRKAVGRNERLRHRHGRVSVKSCRRCRAQ